MERLKFDVAVVGAGPAGVVLADELSSSGLDIGLIESHPGRSQGPPGESVGYPYFRLRRARASGPGGSSTLWLDAGASDWPVNGGLRSRPLDRIDFERVPGVRNAQWPFDHHQLVPFYQRAHRTLGLGAFEYDAASLPDGAFRLSAPGSGDVEDTVCRFGPGPRVAAIIAEGAERPSMSLHTGLTVTELRTDTTGRRIVSMLAARNETTNVEIHADRFVLACGGIENARLLLVSRDRHSSGLGNSSGHVGRWFNEHLHVDAGLLWPVSADWREQFAFYRRHEHAGTNIIGALRPTDETQRRERMLNSVVGFAPRPTELTPRAVRLAAQVAWGVRERSLPQHWPQELREAMAHPLQLAAAARRRWLGGASGEAVCMVVTSEQAPNPQSRVTLAARRDRWGRPIARLEWRLSGVDRHTVRRSVEIVGHELERGGLGRFESMMDGAWGFPRFYGCWHHMGTTRLSADPRDGVVDANCRVHELDNLYIAGSSVMPTGGATTVTLSIVALALRLADHLRGGRG